MEDSRDSTRTLGALLERRTERYGEDTFFRYQNEAYSYADLDSRANAIANELMANGVSTGDVVCLYMYNSPEYLYTIFALAKIGAVAAPIDTRFAGKSLSDILTETDASVVIVDAKTEAEYEAVRNEMTTVSAEYFAGDGDPTGSYRDFDLLLQGDSAEGPETTVEGHDTCSVVYIQRYQRTAPQGVELPHYAYLNTGRETCCDILDLGEEDCIFTTLPFYSSYPMQIGVTGALMSGAEFTFEKQFDRDQFWGWLEQYDATVFLYLGRMLSVLYNREERASDAENPATCAIGHGFGFESDETMIASFERRFDMTVLEAYGTTPTATLATANRPGDRRLGSVGKPASYVDVTIVDEDDWEVPVGEAGEILVRSTAPNTMLQGIKHNDQLTAEICRNQWIHTNDVGYLDEDGYLYFVGSKMNTIHLGRVAGRISSLEIESVIDTHPKVQQSVVVGVSTRNGEEDIKAIVVPEAGESPSPIEVSEHCEKRLTYHKLPRYIEIRKDLPRSPSGKIRKEQLRDVTGTAVWDRRGGYDLNH